MLKLIENQIFHRNNHKQQQQQRNDERDESIGEKALNVNGLTDSIKNTH